MGIQNVKQACWIYTSQNNLYSCITYKFNTTLMFSRPSYIYIYIYIYIMCFKKLNVGCWCRFGLLQNSFNNSRDEKCGHRGGGEQWVGRWASTMGCSDGQFAVYPWPASCMMQANQHARCNGVVMPFNYRHCGMGCQQIFSGHFHYCLC
jgi:hypothetical protein